eukprot:GFYU01003454.1.p1 GENE.GFYU01003454.1~~GFYU01003454.1.p1  ORF type:complete len:135 (-),score=34.24 GFYU01003454.1:267-671(-)
MPQFMPASEGESDDWKLVGVKVNKSKLAKVEGVSDKTLREFSAALDFVESSKELNLSRDVRLEFYGLYKYAVNGPLTKKQPSMVNFVGRAKWEAYNKVSSTNLTQEGAMKVYIDRLGTVDDKWRTTQPTLASKL